MMMIAGVIFLVLGILSGAALALAPFGIGNLNPGIVSWGLFPVLTILGYLFLLVGTRNESASLVTRIASGALFGLAVASVVGVFVIANGIVPATGSSVALWYVIAFGLMFGTAGVALPKSDKKSDPAS